MTGQNAIDKFIPDKLEDVWEPNTDDLESGDITEEILLSRIPLLAGDSKKARYLSYRAVGFPVVRAAELVEVDLPTVRRWRKTDSTFRDFEGRRLIELQKTASKDVVRLHFLRNMMMMLEYDQQLIEKVKDGLSPITDAEERYFREIRRHYTAREMLALEQAANPDDHKPKVTINLTWGNDSLMENVDYLDAPEVRELGNGESPS